MERAKLDKIVAEHAKWLAGDDGQRADLSRAHLSGADLSGANLPRANLSEAYLSGANLSRAHLSGADLSGANLSRANLSVAYLSGANLSRAHLSGTILQPTISPWEWSTENGYPTRTIQGRILVMGRRSGKSQHTGNTVYLPDTIYTAPVFSTDHTAECHPGLYIAGKSWDVGKGPISVAFWLDELIVCGGCLDKARVPLFRVVKGLKAFKALRFRHMQPPEATDDGA